VKWMSLAAMGACMRPIKSSAYTSSSFASCVVDMGVVGRELRSLGMQWFSMACGASWLPVLIFSYPISLAVSVAVQKSGGDLVHPICRQVETASLMGSSACKWGST